MSAVTVSDIDRSSLSFTANTKTHCPECDCREALMTNPPICSYCMQALQKRVVVVPR